MAVLYIYIRNYGHSRGGGILYNLLAFNGACWQYRSHYDRYIRKLWYNHFVQNYKIVISEIVKDIILQQIDLKK